METNWKAWEKPLLEIQETIEKLKQLAAVAKADRKPELQAKIDDLEQKQELYISKIYSQLTPWEKVLVSRAEPRPYTQDYIQSIFTNFIELSGDRRNTADHAIIGGPAMLSDIPCMVIGHQKGRNIQERQKRNFGMSKPEGYRKAIRLMDMADRFNMPIISFIDTSAADPSVESETRGISEAIAASMLKMFEVEVPIICTVIGEGGSGGGLGIGVGNHVMMLEHSVYSVIPPEGCAAILWRDPQKASLAAECLRLTAQSALELKIIDEILQEPFGGAHRNPVEATDTVKKAIYSALDPLLKLSKEKLKQHRYDKFRNIGIFESLK
jgi:acetyl-CoA carboxylase carboxyl transferase subunit alpha